MTDEQADKLIIALEALTTLIAQVSRPPVIVTSDEGCEMVMNYRKRGYPVYVIPDRSAEREASAQEFMKALRKDTAPV